MKQIGIRLEEELIKKVKQYGLDNNISLQNIVSEAITSYLDNKSAPISPDSNDNKITNKHDNKLESKQVSKKKEKKKPEPKPAKQVVFVPTPDEDELPEEEYYILRKPGYEGRPETQHTRKTNLTVEWWLEEGDSQYYDEFQNIIPFRYKKADGTDYLPNAAEIKKLEEEYEKPVKIEK